MIVKFGYERLLGKKCKWVLVGRRFITVEITEPRKTDGFTQDQCLNLEQDPGGRERGLEMEPEHLLGTDIFFRELHWEHPRNLGGLAASPKVRPLSSD